MEKQLAEVVDGTEIKEITETQILCSCENDGVSNMCSSENDHTCGDHSCTTSDQFVRILDFRHFERHFTFSQSDRKTYKKAVLDGVNVSVVLDVVSRNI